jgi:spoIIIJ-associated protein
MDTLEFEGKTTEEAIENASLQLNLPIEELDIDIIEPGSAGIFGLVGNKKAKIKVTFRKAIMPHDAYDEPGHDENELVLAKEVLENILALIPVETTVNAEQMDKNLALNIKGDTSGLLIGRKGKTLDALQFIVNKIVNKTVENKTRVIIDSENYRQKRRESLTQLALRMGDKAKKIQKSVSTNPLNPGDRRIIHLALKEDEKLDTRSRGEGLLKKVLITPKGR